ncbi:DNA glycosylase AlkZ-like family protein [Nocardioides pantholopis]|uniref:DNA glycosylase AlkZ-like family protein n=1 Tax=Nocardioides pantholopis TaxID=2483798 RepID=UPI000FDAFB45|nr:crosslink repair DNA glycosylase YcaQ family protein [Nocardioides pantholopis]
MVTIHRLSRAEARRIAVRAQLLTQERSTDLAETVRRLWLVRLEPTSAIAPSADLVLWSRIGAAYDPQDLRDALDEQRLVELRGTVRHPDDLAAHRAEMAIWPGEEPLRDWQERRRDWLLTNDECRRDVLSQLRADGPLPTSELPDTCVQPWRSSGWNNQRNLVMLLGLLVENGEVAVAGRNGRDKLWDLADRVYPDDPVPDLATARRLRAERRLAALGLARAAAAEMPGEPVDVGPIGEPAVVEGVRGRWWVEPGQLDRVAEPLAGRAVLLSPFDRLLYDRKRVAELFEFDYILEMYKPAAQRRWGYYALPILYGDRLVGKLDARFDRDEGELLVHAVHRDEPFDAATRDAVDAEIESLRAWLVQSASTAPRI